MLPIAVPIVVNGERVCIPSWTSLTNKNIVGCYPRLLLLYIYIISFLDALVLNIDVDVAPGALLDID